MKTDAHAGFGDHQHVGGNVQRKHRVETVALPQVQRAEFGTLHGVLAGGGTLQLAPRRDEKQIGQTVQLLRRGAHQIDGFFAVFQPGQHAAEQRAAILGLVHLRQRAHIQLIAVADIGKEEQGVIRVRLKGIHGRIVRLTVLRLGRFFGLGPAAAQIPFPGEGDQRFLRHLFFLHQRLHHVVDFLDGGAAVVAELIGHGPKLLLDDVHELLFVLQNGFQFGNGFQKLGVFLAQGQNFQPGQALETHVQNGLGLDLRQTEALHQARLGRLGVLAFADELDDLVQIVHGDHQAL